MMQMFRVCFGMLLSFLVFVAIAMSPKSLPEKDALLLSYLVRWFPTPENGLSEIPKVNELDFDVGIWSANFADECTWENFHRSCRNHRLFVTVAVDRPGGRTFGVELGPAYGWEMVGLEQIQGDKPCVMVKVAERVVAGTPKVPEWRFDRRDFCISPWGLVPIRR